MKNYFFYLLMLVPLIGTAQIDLPITFEDTATVDYMLVDFGGNASMIVVDPTDSTNLVGQATKTENSEVWAGTTNGGSGLANPVPFDEANTILSVRVWSPTAGTPIRLKVENAADGGIFAELDALTTVAGEWETLLFDFAQPDNGALNLANTYDKVSIFFNFGTSGTGETYYWDDIAFAGGGGISKGLPSLPITFEDTATVDYALGDFGGNASMIVTDPADSTNIVGMAIKTEGSEVWGGTTMGTGGLAMPIPLSDGNLMMSAWVWSPTAGTPIRLKVEDAGNAAISVETDAITTMAEQWELLTFNFGAPAEGTAAFDGANTYNKISIFFNFGTPGTGESYFWDNVMMMEDGGSDKMQLDLPVTFEDTATVNYALADFGGNASMIVVDPTDENNLVVQATKTAAAEVWGGTTIGADGLASAIPFSETDTRMTVRVWSPDADIPVRLKVENAADGGIFAEVDANTTVAGDWETLTFDFSSPDGGGLNLDLVYDKVSIFFNFGTSGADAGEKTYFFDDIIFSGGGGFDKMQVDLPITFEDTASVDYALASFGGVDAALVVDPTDENNLVGQAIKTNVAEVWGGVAVGGNGLATPIDFSADTKFTVRVWSPDANTPVLLKVENATDGGIFVETLANTTVGGEWETLEFDFANPAQGEINLSNVYDKLVIFFNFGTSGADAGEKTYYWDDMIFLGMDTGLEVIDFDEAGIKVSPNPTSNFINLELPNSLDQRLRLNIFNSSGQLVKNEIMASASNQINVSDLNSGIYYLRIQTEEAVITTKLMITK